MLPRSFSRWLAPLALLAALGAVLFVVSGSTKEEESDGGPAETTQEERREARGETGTQRTGTSGRTTTGPERRTYTVRPGDTLALISERTGVPVDELVALNPRVDPNNLTVGQKIKLTE